jgi:cell division protease FtsH
VPGEFASVQPRGASLGMVVPGASESEPVLSKQRVKAYLQVFLAGIAAEKMIGLTGDAQTVGGTDD